MLHRYKPTRPVVLFVSLWVVALAFLAVGAIVG